MALTAQLSQAGITPNRIHTIANVRLDKVGEAFAITRVELQTEADIPGIDDATFQTIALDAKQNCPVSKALAGTEIHLTAKLLMPAALTEVAFQQDSLEGSFMANERAAGSREKAHPLVERVLDSKPPIARLIGFDVQKIGDGHAVGFMKSGPQHANPMGTLHGGVMCDLADAAMGMAFASTLAQQNLSRRLV